MIDITDESKALRREEKKKYYREDHLNTIKKLIDIETQRLMGIKDVELDGIGE